MNAASLLKGEALCKSWSPEAILFKDLRLNVQVGQSLWISGESGCGKSTLLRCLCRLETLSGGRLWIDGRDVSRTHAHQLPSTVIWVPAQPYFFRTTWGEDLSYYQRHARHKAGHFAGTELLQRLQLPQLNDQTATSQLSLGQAKRLCLIRALLTGPALLLLDEPLSNLDEGNCQAVLALLADYCQKGGAVIATAHHPPAGVEALCLGPLT